MRPDLPVNLVRGGTALDGIDLHDRVPADLEPGKGSA